MGQPNRQRERPLRVIPEPATGTRAVIVREGEGTVVFRQEDGLDLTWVCGTCGAPLIEGALGWIECRVADEHSTGDHTFFVGDVVSAKHGPGRAALLHLRQAYE